MSKLQECLIKSDTLQALQSLVTTYSYIYTYQNHVYFKVYKFSNNRDDFELTFTVEIMNMKDFLS